MAIDHKGHFRKILAQIFKSNGFSWYYTYIFEKLSQTFWCRIRSWIDWHQLQIPKMNLQKVRLSFSNCTFSFWDQFNEIKVFFFFGPFSNNCRVQRKKNWFINLVPRVPSLYIWKKCRLKNHVTTMPLLQRKTTFFIHLCFWGKNRQQIEEHSLWEAFIVIKKSFFWFVLTRLHFSSDSPVCL